MAVPTDISFTSDYDVHDDGSVAFRCSRDERQWPWLELPPCHPVVITTESFWISVGCSVARGTMDPEKWSALTWMDWQCGDPGAGHGVRGEMRNTAVKDELGFAIELFDEKDRCTLRMRGKGVVFRNRDFEGWRNKAKREVRERAEASQFTYAEAARLGLPDGEHPLIAPLVKGPPVHAFGLITEANGMPPASRHLSGSGDHVNATHLAEVGRQFIALLVGDPQVRFAGGELTFSRYVELGIPFRVTLAGREEEKVELEVQQAGRSCTSMVFILAR